DLTFGLEGQVLTDFGAYEVATAGAIQRDGKIVVGGTKTTYSGNSLAVDIALARYKPDGSLDATFGNGGRVVTDLSPYDRVNALAVQRDGKIVAVGVAGDTSNTIDNFLVLRYNRDGSLDRSFGRGGVV